MAFSPPVPKKDLQTVTDEQILNWEASVLILPEAKDAPDRTDWDEAFRIRAGNISKLKDFISKLKNTNFAYDRSQDNILLQQYKTLESDLERIIVWDVSTFIPGVNESNSKQKIPPEQPRLRQVFKLLGQEYSDAVKRVKKGQAIGKNSVVSIGTQKAR